MIDIRHFLLLISCFFLSVLTRPVLGQLVQPDAGEPPQGVGYILVPAFAYSSDLGLIGGILGQRIDYGNGDLPFNTRSLMSLTASTKGLLSFEISHDRIRSFNTDTRSTFDLSAERFLQQHYFGIGNESSFDRSAWNEGFNNFESREIRLDYTARRNFASSNGTTLDLQLLFGAVYNSPKQLEEDTRFAADIPYGSGGGWSFSPGIGLLVENRDNEFDTRRGIRYEARFSGALPALSDFGYGKFSLDLRNFLPVIPNVVLAHQLKIQRTIGDVPFWDMPFIGSERELRGYAEERFLGESTWASITELRAWILELDQYDIRLGLHGFWDTGRVFSGNDASSGVFEDLKHTVGFGGAISLFNPDFIFRGDVGFSDELYRIYVGIGYLF